LSRKKLILEYLPTIITIIGGYSLLIIINNFVDGKYKCTCLFKIITGIPCPGCGMGRATLSLISGKFIDSLKFNILAIPFNAILLASLALMIFDIISKNQIFNTIRYIEISKSSKTVIGLIILLNWILNIIRNI